MSEWYAKPRKHIIDDLAKHFDYDPVRIRSILERVTFKSDSGTFDWPNFTLANVYLPTDQAVQIFEREDLSLLATGERLADYWLDRMTPCYSLDKLQSITEEFVGYLESNRDLLVKTGRPENEFLPSAWFDCHLGRLYYDRRASGSEEQILTAGLTAEESARIVDGRSRFLDLKIQVLKILARALSRGKAKGLRNNCLTLIDGELPTDDICVHFLADELYPRHVESYDYLATGPMSGGLSNLLFAVGHVEKELTVGTLDQASTCLPSIGSFGLDGTGAGLYQLIKADGFEAVSRAIDVCFALQENESIFWEGYVKAIVELADELCAQPSTPTPTQDDCLVDLRSSARECADWISRLTKPSVRWLTNASESEQSPPSDLEPFDDYRMVKIGNVEIFLTGVQAATVRILHKAYEDGRPLVTWYTIRNELRNDKTGYTPANFSQIFRHLPPEQKKLLTRHKGRDQFGLNLKPKP